ncbi:Hypothetical protein D9617_9g025850 [Elsinoe fawcettii]|nr:Hypothetical protein D9617_9g025850 [Elsinoe fawcettii]
MSEKRPPPSTTSSSHPAKRSKTSSSTTSSKPRKGISVGPANLPDGQWKKRNQRIKRSLIEKAKLRSDYRKLKASGPEIEEGREKRYYAQAERDDEEERVRRRMAAAEEGSEDEEGEELDAEGAVSKSNGNGDGGQAEGGQREDEKEISNMPHPDRQLLLDRPASPPPLPQRDLYAERMERRQRRPKPVPFAREQRLADERKREAEERRERLERAHKEREEKNAERERFRRAMAKARTGGKNGQRKLGRESGVLLEKVKRIMTS